VPEKFNGQTLTVKPELGKNPFHIDMEETEFRVKF
jgi:hypothetical protein